MDNKCQNLRKVANKIKLASYYLLTYLNSTLPCYLLDCYLLLLLNATLTAELNTQYYPVT